jgi:exodeoxyribonuclease VII small subunit
MSRKKNIGISQEINFEQSFSELEEIVDALENKNLSLGDLVSYFEKGSMLLKECDVFLRSARKRLEKIVMLGNDEKISISEIEIDDNPENSENDLNDDDDFSLR